MNKYDTDSIKKYWNLLFDSETLLQDETIRTVTFIEEDNVKQTNKRQINSLDQLIGIVEKCYDVYGEKGYGIAISPAIFKYVEDSSPSSNSFRATKTLILDFDTSSINGGDKVILREESCIYNTATKLRHKVEEILKNVSNNEIIFKPSAIAVTGAGFQLIYKFDKLLVAEEVKPLYEFLKKNLGDIKITTSQKGLIGDDDEFEVSIDNTSFDIVHAERLIGTLHNKHKMLSYFIAYDNPYYNNSAVLKEFAKILLSKPISNMASSSKLIFEICQNVKVFDVLRDKLEIISESEIYSKVKCPFHSESTASFIIYHNNSTNKMDVCKDFHDNESYNVIELYSKIYGLTTAEAIQRILSETGLKLTGKNFTSDLKKIKDDEMVESAITRVDTENYIYYRLPNRVRMTKIRDKKTGKEYIFDGLTSLCNMVLTNQLNITDASAEFRKKFVEEFENKILQDAFEKFMPGQGIMKNDDNFIVNINTWVPNDNYTLVQRKSEEVSKRSIKETIALLEEKCPTITIYLKLLCQYGNFNWLINWLSHITQMEGKDVNEVKSDMIPVFFGCQGVGKNQFVNRILRWYFSEEYIAVISPQRVGQQFNSFLQNKNLIILDESEITAGSLMEIVKMYTGNDRLAIERKGVDANMEERLFSFITFSNSTIPFYHNIKERRFQYFPEVIPMPKLLNTIGYSYETFFDKIYDEILDFFIILNTTIVNKTMVQQPERDACFLRQCLKQHPFGKLITTIIDKDWNKLITDINSNETNSTILKTKSNTVTQIKNSFEKNGRIPLIVINQYMEATKRKNSSFRTVAQFIEDNGLEDWGVTIVVGNPNEPDNFEANIVIDVNKLTRILNNKNILDDVMEMRLGEEFAENFITEVSLDSYIDKLEDTHDHNIISNIVDDFR